MSVSVDDVREAIRSFLAQVTGREAVSSVSFDSPLFGDDIALDSLSATALLAFVDQTYGVDVAALDLALSSLESIAALADFVVASRLTARH